MIYKFRVLSGDENAFLRDYEIDSHSSFLNFHSYIQNELGFEEGQLASFFVTDEQWNKGLELTLIDMENDAGLAAIPMDSVKLEDLLKNKKDRLFYIYDIFSDRGFFIELSDIFQPKEGVKYPRCTSSIGEAPEQFQIENIIVDDFYIDPDNLDEIVNDIGFDDYIDEIDAEISDD